MTPLLRKLLGMNWLLVAMVLALSVFGVVAINSATWFNPDTENLWHKQIVWLGIGLPVFFITSLVDYRHSRWVAVPMFLASIVFVALTYVIGKKIGGARCWLPLPGVGLFQPSQMAVVSGVLVVSLFLSHFQRLNILLRLAGIGAIVGLPMVLILGQPDFGMTIVWVPVIVAIMLAAKIPKRWLILLVQLGLTLLPLVICFGLKDYQRKRIVSFTDPEIDPLGTGWAINQALIAIGSGGFGGKGFKAVGTQVEQGFIPDTTVHTDYIFVPIAEQWGFFGAALVIIAFGALLFSCVVTAYNARDEYGLLITCGFAAQIFFHVYQNVGMTIALMPITGLPLPLISYGGTFLVFILFALGLVNSVWIHRKPEAA